MRVIADGNHVDAKVPLYHGLQQTDGVAGARRRDDGYGVAFVKFAKVAEK